MDVKRRYVFVYYNYKKLCTSAEEAIEFINSLSFQNQKLICNTNCAERIQALFNGKPVYYPSGYINYIEYLNKIYPGFYELATTGCSTTRIRFFPALAETLEKHDEIYQEQCKVEREARLAANRERLEMRFAELNENRKGWYSVSLEFKQAKFGRNGIRYVDTTFTGKTIAENGMDAYSKAIKEIENSYDILPDSLFPEPHSNDFEFFFLGVKTDEGYSSELWDEWQKNRT